MNRADLRPFWRLARRALRDAFAPRTCVLCAAPIATGPNRPLCRGCAAALPLWRRADGCPRCRMPSDPEVPGSPASWGGARAGCPTCLAGGSALHRWLAATRYSGPIQHLVPAFKNPRGPFGPAPDACRLVDYLAEGLAARLVRETGGAPELIVPIPLHPGRLRRRGFNQADWIAHRIARTLGRLPCLQQRKVTHAHTSPSRSETMLVMRSGCT